VRGLSSDVLPPPVGVADNKRLLVITSCTASKAVRPASALTPEDVRRGRGHVGRRTADVGAACRPAENMYTGQQHTRLMRGVRALRARDHRLTPRLILDLRIVSGGYGVIRGDRAIAPYESSFAGLSKAEARDLALLLNVPRDMRAALSARYDLGVVLLGDDYLRACALDEAVRLGGPTLVFCGSAAARRLPHAPSIRPVPLSHADTARFRAGAITLKGEIGGRLLARLAADPSIVDTLRDPATDVLALLCAPA